MSGPFPELAGALTAILDKIDETIRASGHRGPAIRMYLAGGLAVNYHCGSRYTEDVDASFSQRILLPVEKLVADYSRRDGSPSFIYFDANYNPAFALMHPDYERDAVEWKGIGNERRLVHLYVLSPLDLAVSKVARFSAQDREDILLLVRTAGFSVESFKARAEEAMAYYIGDQSTVRSTLKLIEREIRR